MRRGVHLVITVLAYSLAASKSSHNSRGSGSDTNNSLREAICMSGTHQHSVAAAEAGRLQEIQEAKCG